MTGNIRLGIVGCGAIVESAHLPALTRLSELPVVLIDKDLDRARALSEKFGVTRSESDYRVCLNDIDAAIVALPHCLHAPVTSDLLAHGINVLVEKPMATSLIDCQKMILAAEKRQVGLAVGLMRPYLHVNQWLRSLLSNGLLGRIHAVDVKEGGVFAWPVASQAFFQRDIAGGGVLIDVGSHIIDLLLWLFGPTKVSSYLDDNYGGVEADCLVSLQFDCGAQALVEISRTRKLRNTIIISGDRGTVEVSLHENLILQASPHVRQHRVGRRRTGKLPKQEFMDLFCLELSDWLRGIDEGNNSLESANRSAQTISLIEHCYRHRAVWELPWMAPTIDETLLDRGSETSRCL